MKNQAIIVFSILLTCCVIGNIVMALMHRRLKQNHSTIWRSFQFPNDSAWTGSESEGENAHAQLRHFAFLLSGKWRGLGDSYYNALASAFTAFAGGAIVALIVFIYFTFHGSS